MEHAPILVDGETVDTGQYVMFPNMEKVIMDPGIAIALQMQKASRVQRFVISKIPAAIPESTAEIRYLKDYCRHHGVPKYSRDELEEAIYAKVSLSRESDIRRAISAGVRDHEALYNPLKIEGQGVTLDERIDALYKAGLEVKRRFKEVRDITIKEGTPIRTFEWTWSMFSEYLERETFEIWGSLIDLKEFPGKDGGRNYQVREPYGVTCLFTPYNSPLALGILSITSSILAGNATVLKPPSKVPLSTILLARIFMETFNELGFPRAMIQTLTGGGKSMMNRFMSDPNVNAIVWYGDSDTGIEIWANAIRQRIQLAPELAGSDACLVWGKDVDLEFAAKMIVKGRFLGSGQACMAVKRLLVQDSLYDDLVEFVVEEASKLKVGLPSDPNVSLPPVGLTALYLLLDQMQDARAKGAKVVYGGRRINWMGEDDPAGLFYEPTILTEVSLDMRIMQEEVFAPALPVYPVNSVDRALKVANSSRFGLRSSIFTNDLKAKQQWAKGIQAAGVTVMQDHLYFDPYMPHLGGYKDSGIIGAKNFQVMLTRMKYIHLGPGIDLK